MHTFIDIYPDTLDKANELSKILNSKISSKKAVDLLEDIFFTKVLVDEIKNAKHKRNVRNIIISNMYLFVLKNPKLSKDISEILLKTFYKHVDEIKFLVGKAPKIIK